MQDSYKNKIKAVRYQYLDSKKKRKGDMFVAQWLNLKIVVGQSRSARNIKKIENELNNFYTQSELQTMLSENSKIAKKVIFEEIKDAATIYQQACSEDSHYTTRLFGLMKMKEDEIANKAGDEVYNQVIRSLMLMSDSFWRNQMIVAIHLAYQEVFGKHAIKADLFFEEPDEYDTFEKIMEKTIKEQGVN